MIDHGNFRNGLNPQPPHVEIGVYIDGVDHTILNATCEALQTMGGHPTGVALVGYPEGFRYVTDLPLILGTWPARCIELQPYRVGFVHSILGEMSVTFAPSTPPNCHPIAIRLSAGPFSIPERLWSPTDHRSALHWRTSIAELYKGLCDALDPIYASIGIEESIPTPSELARGAPLPFDLYVANRVIDIEPMIRQQLLDIFGAFTVQEGPSGIYFSTWSLYDNSFPKLDYELLVSASPLLAQAITKDPNI